MKPISFALIGKEVNFFKLDPRIVAYGLLIIVAGSIVSTIARAKMSNSALFLRMSFSRFQQVRLCIAYASAFGVDLNRKERVYVTISSFPKATVQAALGPVALDQIRQHNIDSSSMEAHMANIILISSVLAIVLTAPLGAILMVKMAPKFLQKCQPQIPH